MTPNQEEAFFDFLDNVSGGFELDELVSYIRMIDPAKAYRLPEELESYIKFRNLAFPDGKRRWLSRRGFFESFSFVISPSRLELLNGILIPGHRCLPFANPGLLPPDYSFSWQGSPIPFTSTEGPPEEFYPYYAVFGEEYAPQYIARDNSENEEAFNSDPYDDPPEVSVKTLDMRNIYRETSFVPGDRFCVKTLDWKRGEFELAKLGKGEWAQAELDDWLKAAEKGFEESFAKLGPASCTEEQVAYAYWYGAPRMRELPAYSLEEFLYEKTNKIEIQAYGIETRFWFAGREIPDTRELDLSVAPPDRTPIEDILYALKIPVSEYVIQSYIRDSLYRGESDAASVVERLIPVSVELDGRTRRLLSDFIEGAADEFRDSYSSFRDRTIGPIRQRAGELHTAVIDLAAGLGKGEIDSSWLPRHTFIVLSQIQSHCSGVMEDLDSDETPPEEELEALDNSLDNMIETYEDVKELIDEALDTFRRNRLAVVRPGSGAGTVTERLLQLSMGGVDVWRRLILPEDCRLGELHSIIQTVFGWRNSQSFRFTGEEPLPLNASLGDLEAGGLVEFLYEYGTKWTVKVLLLSRQEITGARPVRCVAGAGAAPDERIEGPLKYRRLLSALEGRNDAERLAARRELGPDFVPGEFDLEACNRDLGEKVPARENGR